MLRMLLRIISVDFNVKHQLLTIHSALTNKQTNKQTNTSSPENNFLFPTEMSIGRKDTVPCKLFL